MTFNLRRPVPPEGIRPSGPLPRDSSVPLAPLLIDLTYRTAPFVLPAHELVALRQAESGVGSSITTIQFADSLEKPVVLQDLPAFVTVIPRSICTTDGVPVETV